jgi:hypothetical protein
MSVAYTLLISGALGEGMTKENVVPAGLNERLGRAAGDHIKGHFLRLDNERANPMGGQRSHFYWEAAQTISSVATTDGAEVTINKLGLRQRWLGGTISAKNSHFLTIPARAESYGVPAREFPQKLRFIQFRSGTAALVIDDQNEPTDSVDNAGNVSVKRGTRNKRKKTAGIVEYWLVPSVYQHPDASVLPTSGELSQVVAEAANEYLLEQN